ncbi:D-alanyl-D-alanine carboxypeptidase/D-alanyl-D-alanine-endopeptidase [Novosphingobium sp. LASN5T]|uniref:D-alanyl-D-alanine carboxypeptidase/D-alanyl-D-alanine endopeptidase n=1 Tax=Novosphingobium sp. LASN5T TaxID=2491021 RepID=UPI001CC1DA9D|nr:D-alanyl-D-alanine carboxypeptidase/D-alanyl-D-alanine-endopeptidase [Novosphingobium sp. LASN5T]
MMIPRMPCLVLALACAATPVPAALAAPPPAQAASLQDQVEQVLATAPAGTRFGLLVTTADGREIVAINPDARFIPASNTKLFTTIAAYAMLPGIDAPDAQGGAAVALEAGGDVALYGHGDARLSSAPDCAEDCLATLADAVAARTRKVRDVIGDDRWFPDERWSTGMSWNNQVTESGTGISALSLDDNALELVVQGAAGEQTPQATLPYYRLRNEAVTVEGGTRALAFDRAPNGDELRLAGTIPAGVSWRYRVGIDDPAHYAASRLRALLEARGVKVTGAVRVRHRPATPLDDPRQRGTRPVPAAPEPVFLARLSPPALAADVMRINKDSQNLHAELLLRRIGRLSGSGSVADGLAALRGVLAQAGLPRAGYDFFDGSGMSTYNRASPRATVLLLRWAAGQPWGAAWRATLPVGGVDGTLKNRFAATPLQGAIFAKTGSLNASNALSGFLRAASGQELIFSIYANDVPDGVSALPALDRAVQLIAAQN